MESKTPVLGAVLNNVALSLSTYYYSQYSANKKYSAYYIQESYLDDSDEIESSENDELASSDMVDNSSDEADT